MVRKGQNMWLLFHFVCFRTRLAPQKQVYFHLSSSQSRVSYICWIIRLRRCDCFWLNLIFIFHHIKASFLPWMSGWTTLIFWWNVTLKNFEFILCIGILIVWQIQLVPSFLMILDSQTQFPLKMWTSLIPSRSQSKFLTSGNLLDWKTIKRVSCFRVLIVPNIQNVLIMMMCFDVFWSFSESNWKVIHQVSFKSVLFALSEEFGYIPGITVPLVQHF